MATALEVGGAPPGHAIVTRRRFGLYGAVVVGLVLLILVGATTVIALGRRPAPVPLDYRPASAEPAAPLTLTHLRAV